MNITERINRILFILSYVSQNQGVSVEELAERTGLPSRELLKEIEFILLIGKPPFQPDDYIDIYVEEDRVYVEFDQMLNRPLRFTRPEAISILMSLQLLDPQVDPETVQSLKRKIHGVIDQSVDPSAYFQDRIAFEQPSIPVSEQFDQLRAAIESYRKVRIEYYALAHDRTSKRVIRPYLLTKSLGYWYLSGYCELRSDLRTFKFERILSVRVLEDGFPPPQDLDVARQKQNFLQLPEETQVEIYFSPEVAPWIREQWGLANVSDAPDGGVILKLFTGTLEFPSRLVLSYAPHARPLAPESLIEKVRQDARQLVEIYTPSPVS